MINDAIFVGTICRFWTNGLALAGSFTVGDEAIIAETPPAVGTIHNILSVGDAKQNASTVAGTARKYCKKDVLKLS